MDQERARRIAAGEVEDALSLLFKKNADYSSSRGDNIADTGLIGIATRLTDKISRLRSLAGSPSATAFESLDDTLRDIRNYALIGTLLREGAWSERPALVYLAGPIDGVPRAGAHDWRQEVAGRLLSEYGISSFNPAAAFTAGQRAAASVVAINRNAIDSCDLLLAYLDGAGGYGFETVREIEYARSRNKRVLAVCKHPRSFGFHDLEVIPSLDRAVSVIAGAV